jgi:cryptochrome
LIDGMTCHYIVIVVSLVSFFVTQSSSLSSSSSAIPIMMKKAAVVSSATSATASASAAATAPAAGVVVAMHWFRKGLRLADHPALLRAIELSKITADDTTTNAISCRLYPVYVLDADCYQLRHCSAKRATFLLDCLRDLDDQLRTAHGTRLYVTSGDPTVVLPELWKRWKITDVTCDIDETGEPYGVERDAQIAKLAADHNVRFLDNMDNIASETIFSLADYMNKAKNTVPYSMTAFQKLFDRMGLVPLPQRAMPANITMVTDDLDNPMFNVPDSATQLPWPRHTPRAKVQPLWTAADCEKHNMNQMMVRGGERLALERLQRKLSDVNWVANFAKPDTSYTMTADHDASTLVLSPYLSLGCISPRTVWHSVADAISKSSVKKPTQPPVSLHGQLLWREFNNFMAFHCNTEKPGSWGIQSEMIQVNSQLCRNIPWSTNTPELQQAWETAATGYPWIDACLTQLHQTGWIHHLGRHAVACFLTRGDLFQSWEIGAKHFECHLLDADYALNVFNWLWLSASSFFYQYFRCYSPVAFAQKHDKSGRYIRKWLPVLKKLPDAYIYAPWTAPNHVLQQAGVVLGDNYPHRIVDDHTVVSKDNMAKMARAYEPYQQQPKKTTTTPKAKQVKKIGNDKTKNNNNHDVHDEEEEEEQEGKKRKASPTKEKKKKTTTTTKKSKA